MKKEPIKYIELFAGIGGFRYGFDKVGGFQSVYSNEWDEVFQKKTWMKEHETIEGFSPLLAYQIYRRHYGEIDTRDIRDVSGNEIPDHDLLTAGFPCQAFSVAGKGLGFEDTRGTLFFEIARITQRKRPRHILLENVKNLLGHDSGKTLNRIFGILSDLGYRVEWQVLNSKHFGVPQNRERVFIVGHLRGKCSGQIFPITGTNGKTLEYVTGGGIKQWGEGKGDLSRQHSQGQRVYSAGGIASTLASEGGGWGGKTGLYAMRGREEGQQLEYRGDETNSLTSVSKDNLWLEGKIIRRLTPITCERLQGFEDGFTEYGMLEDGTLVKISDNQRYKCLGNAVTTNVTDAIGKELFDHIVQN